MAAEEEMVSLISTTPVKALGSAADIVVQLLRFLNDTHISSATGRVVKGVSGAAASAGKGAYNAATRGIEGLGREGTVSMHVLRRVADEAGVDSRLVPVPKDFMGALAKEHNLDDDAMWSVVKKRLTEAGIMHAVVRTSDGTLGVQVLSGTQSGVAACLDQLKGGLNAALAASDGAYVVGTASGADGTASLTAPSDGYYLLVSDPSTVGGQVGESGTQAVLTPIAGDTTVATKTSVPTVTKTVAGEGRDAEGNRIWSEIADRNLVPGYPDGSHALRDIAFKIDVALPDTVTAVGESGGYPLSIVDTLPEGFTYSQDDGTDITAGGWFTVTVSDGESSVQLTPDRGGLSASVSEDGKTLTWTISDLMALKGSVDLDHAVVSVIYDDEALNSKGVVDDVFSQTTSLALPFVNHTYATYKPFTYNFMGGENRTHEDTAKFYSYNLRVDKVGEDAEALKGAAFTLTDADGTVIGKNITAADDGTFCFTGLDSDVEYTLTETQVPSGHKAIEPIKFKIAATASAEGDEITAISATETADPSNAATFTVDDATVVATVVNLSGPQMPVTGAAGIAGGIVVGGALIAVSAASLRKKKASE